jgi:lipopolysaccharide/colanic/teichoic acid biosynthesis glycosyltransferase
MKVLVWVLLVLASTIIEAEVIAWCRPLQRALIRRAAAPLPKPDRERYIEEWHRELEEKPDAPVTRLIFVLSLLLRRASLARALGVSRSVVGFSGALKRLGDIVLASVGLLIASPLMLTIAAVVKLQDGSPPIFRQTRIGQDGKPFTVLKFRSIQFVRAPDGKPRGLYGEMYYYDATSGAKLPTVRITRIGRFLRDFSLDELPYLFSVLRGSMSLVGPRPRSVSELRADATEDASVKPGLTGLWQTSALSSLDTDDATRLDREYVKHWSLWLDIKIMTKTLIAVLGKPRPTVTTRPTRSRKRRRQTG